MSGCYVQYRFFFSKLDDIVSNTHIMTVLFMRVVCLCILSVTVYKCFGVGYKVVKARSIKSNEQKGQSLGFSVYEQSSLGNIGRV